MQPVLDVGGEGEGEAPPEVEVRLELLDAQALDGAGRGGGEGLKAGRACTHTRTRTHAHTYSCTHSRKYAQARMHSPSPLLSPTFSPLVSLLSSNSLPHLTFISSQGSLSSSLYATVSRYLREAKQADSAAEKGVKYGVPFNGAFLRVRNLKADGTLSEFAMVCS